VVPQDFPLPLPARPIVFGKRKWHYFCDHHLSLVADRDKSGSATVRLYKDCVAKNHASQVNSCVAHRAAAARVPNSGVPNSGNAGHRDYCERTVSESEQTTIFLERKFENGIGSMVMGARNLDNQRKAQEAAQIALANAEAQRKLEQAEKDAQRKEEQLREQARRDREAAEEALRFAEREEPKIAEATREAEEAQRQRKQAEDRLAQIRSQIDAQQRRRNEALGQAEATAGAAKDAERRKTVTADGYRLMTVRDFLLDGRELAANQTRVALEGTYTRDGNLDVLYTSRKDLMMLRGNTQFRVSLLTDDASRSLRQTILQCQSSGIQNIGCEGLAVKGHATTCSVWNAFGATHEEPCVAVEDGW
jgi:hypothetical protein